MIVRARRESAGFVSGRAAPQFREERSMTSATTAWRIRAWADPGLEKRFLREGFVAVRHDEFGCPVTSFGSDVELRARLEQHNPGRSRKAIGLFVSYWRNFSRSMRTGHTIVVSLTGRRAAIGTIAGPYEYDPAEPDPHLRHRRAVEWHSITDRTHLDEDLRRAADAPGTLFRLRADDAGVRLRRLGHVA